MYMCMYVCIIYILLHRACCRVTQLLHQPLHIYKIYEIYTLKHKNLSDMFRLGVVAACCHNTQLVQRN